PFPQSSRYLEPPGDRRKKCPRDSQHYTSRKEHPTANIHKPSRQKDRYCAVLKSGGTGKMISKRWPTNHEVICHWLQNDSFGLISAFQIKLFSIEYSVLSIKR